MYVLLLRDLAVIARSQAFLLAVCVHAGLLATFLFVWGHGVPLLPGANLYEQQRTLQWVLLTVLLPWTAARCLPRDGASGITLLAAMTAVHPSRVLIARIAAGFAALCALVASGFPLVVLAQQIAGVPLAQVCLGIIPMLGLAATACASAVWWRLACRDRLTAWLGAAATTAFVVLCGIALVPPGAAAVLLWAVAIAAAIVMGRRSDRALRYLAEIPA